MKRLVALAVFAMFALVSCGTAATTTTPTTIQTTPLMTVAATTTIPTTVATTTMMTTTTAATTTIATTVATTTVAKVGSRTNPAPIGTPVKVTGTIAGDEIQYTIALLEVVRGDKAKQIVMKENRYNKIPAGQEVILAKFAFTLNKWKPRDEEDDYYTSIYDFDYFDKTMTKIKDEALVIPNEFEGKMFEGGSASGYGSVLVPIGEKVLARYDDFVWFTLG